MSSSSSGSRSSLNKEGMNCLATSLFLPSVDATCVITLMSCCADGSSPDIKDDFINRLLETGATESSSSNICSNGTEENTGNNASSSQVTQTLHNLVAATNDIRCIKDELYPTVLRTGLDKGIITFHFNRFSACPGFLLLLL